MTASSFIADLGQTPRTGTKTVEAAANAGSAE